MKAYLLEHGEDGFSRLDNILNFGLSVGVAVGGVLIIPATIYIVLKF